MIKIEKDIPIPPLKTQPLNLRSVLRSMEIGDSFVMERKFQVTVNNRAHDVGISVITRKISDSEVRVWRIA